MDIINKISVEEKIVLIIKELFDIKKVKKGQILHEANSKCKELSLVISGELDVIKYNFDGKEQLISVLGKNEMFGGPLVFSEAYYPANIIAEKDSEIIEISKEKIMKLFIEEEFMLFFLKELGNKIIKLSQTIDYLSDNSIELRLLKYLKLQYVQQNTKIITLNMSKARIAKEIGTVREVVSRTFKKLENKGIIRNLSNNKIEILIKEYF